MANKIRLGFVGANVHANWASQSHFPALLASPDVELTAVCTTRPESAEEARGAFGAKLAFHDVREMGASPEIDAVGGVLSCHAPAMRDGPLARPSSRTWQRDASLGAHTLSIANGHVIDALRFVVGNFTRVACMVTTQVQQWYETDTEQLVEVTSPDNVRVCGQLESGAAASAHVGAVPWAGSGFRMEIYGREGTLVTTGSVSSQRGEMLRVQGAQGSHELRDLAIPERFIYVPADFPAAIRSTWGRCMRCS